jgi:Tfp pilus assembly major pilin PilA
MPIKQGFLLLDLMVAITIFFLATSLTINLSVAVKKMHCIMELFLLKQTIKATQLEAMATGIDQTISIDVESNGYTSPHTTTILKSLSIANKTIPIPHLNNQKNPPAPCSFSHNKITCFKSGIISAGAIYFSAHDDKSLFFCLSCPVSQSNNIHLYEYKNEWTICS